MSAPQEITPAELSAATCSGGDGTALRRPGSGSTMSGFNLTVDHGGRRQASHPRMPDEGYHTGVAEEDVKPPLLAVETGEEFAAPRSDGPRGIELVGRVIRQLVDAINSFEQLGIENPDLPLPKIVVVGDQSAGKSSLVEAISEIKVPRSAGTCTRCPLQINLRTDNGPNAIWSCQVTLQRRYDHYGDHSGDPNSPWVSKDTPSEISFLNVVEKDRLEEAIRLAQIATLNPQENPLEYLPGARECRSESLYVKFSPNVVRLDISGPNLPNLSFYDLPGMINQSENTGEEHLPKLVKQLVKSYITPENVLVLLACSMENDVANSNAAKVVRSAKAADRCIGVLTKPDRIPPGNPVDECRAILSGKIFQLGHGYFVTKQPSQEELNRGITHVEARSNENRFFQRTEPWKSLFLEFQGRFGTLELQKALSEKLTLQILASLPHITARVQKKIDDINDELNALPEPPKDNAMLIVAECLNALCGLIRDDIDAVFPSTQFKVESRKKASRLCEKILNMKPTFAGSTNTGSTHHNVPTSARAVVTPRKATKAPLILKKEPSTSSPIAIESDSDPDQATGPATPSKKRRRGEEYSTHVNKLRPRPQQNSSSQAVLPIPFRLEDLKGIIENVSVSSIPSETDIKAVEHVFKSSAIAWEEATNSFVDEIVKHMRETIHKRIEEALSAWASTDFFMTTRKLADRFLERHCEHLWQVARSSVRRETSRIVTVNKRMLNVIGEEELCILQKSRHLVRASAFLEENYASERQLSSAEWQKKLEDTNVAKALGPDPFKNEIAVLAKTRAYYEVACMRFVDGLYLFILDDFFEKCKTGLGQELKKELGIYQENAYDRCRQLLADDPAREVRRTQLKKEKAALMKAQERLASLKSSTNYS